MADGIGVPFDPPFGLSAHCADPYAVFPRYDTCPPAFGCAGHADPSMLNQHHTAWERFGPYGVVVTLTDGAVPLLSFADAKAHFERPFTAEHGLLVAHEITQAALHAQRFGLLQGLPGTANALRA